jgi:hypothetical protein
MQPGDTLPRKVRLVTALLLGGMFAAGAFTSAGIYHLALPPRPLPPFPQFVEELRLSPDQASRAREIGERHRAQLEAIFREIQPRVSGVQEQMEGELRTVLDDQQRRRLDEFQARRRQLGVHPPGMEPRPQEP